MEKIEPGAAPKLEHDYDFPDNTHYKHLCFQITATVRGFALIENYKLHDMIKWRNLWVPSALLPSLDDVASYAKAIIIKKGYDDHDIPIVCELPARLDLDTITAFPRI